MNKLSAITILLLAFGEAQAHSHPGIDSLTHSLEHLTQHAPAALPYLAGLGLALALALWHSRRPQ